MRRTFGSARGAGVSLYTLQTEYMEAAITDYGATLVSLRTPDRDGSAADIVLGFDSLAGYLDANKPYFGATIGRYANCIANGLFRQNGVEYTLARNDNGNSLHGGIRGFDKVVWDARESADRVEFTYASSHGEEGFPGTLSVQVAYSVRGNELRLDYSAVTDRDTVVNLTNHTYFNLDGQGEGDILNHEVLIRASHFTPIDGRQIPTGELAPVDGTPFDFRSPHRIGARIRESSEQLRLGNGYDHNYVLDGQGLRLVARARSAESGRILDLLSTEPGLQFYTANYLDGSVTGKGGIAYAKHSGFCFETQHFPDSPNQPAFPSTVLKPGERFCSTTVFKLSSD